MSKFIPYEKLSKRERRARDAERRGNWGISPVTRRPPNPRAYNRKKTRTDIERMIWPCFLFWGVYFQLPISFSFFAVLLMHNDFSAHAGRQRNIPQLIDYMKYNMIYFRKKN